MLHRGSGGQGWIEFTTREVGAGSNSQGSGNGGRGWVEFTVKVGAGAGSNSMDKMCRHNSAHMVARMTTYLKLSILFMCDDWSHTHVPQTYQSDVQCRK